MGWLRSFFRTREVIGIAAETLEFVLEAAADAHPNEYMGMLRGQSARELGIDRDGYLVTDVLVIPGTEAGPVSASVKSWMVPNDRYAVGSVHSHPNGVLRPSDEDLQTFGKGEVHIILGAPYNTRNWRAFGPDGEERRLPVFQVELPDPSAFFDFDQSDIDAELREDR